MATLTPPPAAPQRGDRTTFAQRVDAFITWLINFVSELVALVANLNSLAAGGAYAISYVYTEGTLGAGKIGPYNSTNQAGSITWYIGERDINGALVSASIDQFDDSTSAIKGAIRIQKAGDPSKWVRASVTSIQSIQVGMRHIFVTPLDSSSTNPFTEGDVVMLFFDRTGDKGDTGPAGSLLVPRLHMREQYASGTAGPALVSSTWNTRAMNTTVANTISGAVVSGNRVTLDPGTYDFRGWASVVGNDVRHAVGLKSITAGAFAVQGSSEYIGANPYNTNGKSVMEWRLAPAVRTTYEVQHFATASCSGGTAINTGLPECYSEIIFERVA